MPTSLPLAICVAEKAMYEFCQQWFAGLQPCLSLETAPNGEIRVCSKVTATAGYVAAPDPRDAQQGDAGKPRRQRGPSYHRRLQRRAAARKVAAAQQIADEAFQTEVAPDVSALPVVEAAHADAEPFPIQDELCPDKDYAIQTQDQQQNLHTQHYTDDTIPQLDGHGSDVIENQNDEDLDSWINPNPDNGLWVCRCCEYAHDFPTEDDLRLHHDTLIFEYDECNICYPWHVWT